MNAVQALESARDCLEEGRPGRGLRALARAKFPGALRVEADFLSAECRRGQGCFRKAERLYREVLGVNPKQDPALWVEASLGSAAGLRSLGDVAGARLRLSRAKQIVRSFRLAAYRPSIELEEALVDRAAGLYAKSLKRFSILLRDSLRARDGSQAAFILWAMGGALRFKGDLAESKAAFDRSLALARKARDATGRGYALFGLGGVTRIMGRLADSARYYAKAKAAFNGTDDVFGQAYAQCGYANALRQMGRWPEAETRYHRSHALYSRLEDDVDLAYVEWGLGKIYLHRGDVLRAIARLRKALRLFSRGKEARGQALSEMSLAQALHAAGDTAQAEKYFDRSWRRARRRGLHAHLEIYT